MASLGHCGVDAAFRLCDDARMGLSYRDLASRSIGKGRMFETYAQELWVILLGLSPALLLAGLLRVYLPAGLVRSR